MGQLLAVDLGLRTGLAVFGADGRLRAYRSQNLGTRSRLKRAAAGVVAAHTPLAAIAVEGDAALARVWLREAERRGARSLVVAPERWRALLLHPRERRDAAAAKAHAGRVARAAIGWSGARAPAALRHDAAEAICIGLYAVCALGWLDALPPPLDPARR